MKISGMARARIRLDIAGLTGVHAVRAARTALSAVPGIVDAEVALSGAVLQMDEPLDEAALRATLDAVGLQLLRVIVEHARVLPLA